jgi:predicted Fe-Mo cluster-binding NifX family protein
MRVCIPTVSPGGLDSKIPKTFEGIEYADFFDVRSDGQVDLVAETRYCDGGCLDMVEAITKRGVDAIIVGGMGSNSLRKFKLAGVKVLLADNSSPRLLIKSLVDGRLVNLESEGRRPQAMKKR